MTTLVEFIKSLRDLAKNAPQKIVCMPQNSVGLPEGNFCPGALLEYIADCLENIIS